MFRLNCVWQLPLSCVCAVVCILCLSLQCGVCGVCLTRERVCVLSVSAGIKGCYVL